MGRWRPCVRPCFVFGYRETMLRAAGIYSRLSPAYLFSRPVHLMLAGSGRQSMQFWIQRADFEAEDHTAASAEEVSEAFQRHDWAAELEYRASREQAAEEWCWAGLGVVGPDGRILHLCPREAGALGCYYRYPESRRILGIIRTQKQATVSWVDSRNSASQLIQLFFDNRHDELLQHSRWKGFRQWCESVEIP